MQRSRNSWYQIPTLFAVAASLVPAALRSQPPTAVPEGLKRAEPIVCSSRNALVVRGRFIETTGNGIVIQGHCDVEIIDSHIVAGGVGVLAQGHGDAVLTNSSVEGGRAALVAEGHGKIHYRGTTLRGATHSSGHGQIVGDDGVQAGGGGLAGILGGVHVGRSGIEVRDGAKTVSIGAGGIVVDDGTETVAVRPGPGGLRIETDDAAVVLDADVTVEDGLLRLGLGASLEVSDTWRSAGDSTYRNSDTDRLLVELGASDESGELHIGLAGDVLFDLDSAAVRPPGAAELSKVAHVLRQRAAGEIRLVGHTDSLGDDDYNLELSQARALAVMRWLSREERIPTQLMVGQGMGAQQPIAHNTMPDGSDNPAGRARNRRVEVYFSTRP